MSNVLIGIIGVILFIGLALAGALFLGPRFQSASNDAKAAAMMQAVSQLVHARTLWTLENGQPYAGNPAGLTPQYLKSVPVNPSGAGLHNFIFVNDDGSVFDGGGQKVMIVGIDAGSGMTGDSPTVRAICLAAAKQAGQDVSNGLPSSATIASIPGQAGCWKPTQNIGGVNSVFYYIFQRV
jgi:hypothetical protein